MYHRNPHDYLPDVRDGLTRRERIVLTCLYDLQQERGGRNVPTGMLYGSVVEMVGRNPSLYPQKSLRFPLLSLGRGYAYLLNTSSQIYPDKLTMK